MSNYFTEIEAHFAHRRGTPYILNAKDWALMKSWEADGVPLPVVIEAIDSVFDKNLEKGGKKTINSLHYCRHAVKELWADRRELQIGSSDEAPEAGPDALLEALAARIESAPDPVVAAFGARVRMLATQKSVPRIEESLIALEEELVAAYLASSPDARALMEEARSLTVGADEKTRARAEQANLRRLARQRLAIPRLTLFE